MSTTLKKITAAAKKLYKTGKYKKWTDAVKAASKTVVKKKAAKKSVKQTGSTTKKADVLRQAKKPGKRKSATGRTYYEYRANRSDKGRLLGIHKDTKSHNVNIRVMSGISGIKKTAEVLLKKQYGELAAKKLTEKTKRGKAAIQKEMSKVAASIKKVHSI